MKRSPRCLWTTVTAPVGARGERRGSLESKGERERGTEQLSISRTRGEEEEEEEEVVGGKVYEEPPRLLTGAPAHGPTACGLRLDSSRLSHVGLT